MSSSMSGEPIEEVYKGFVVVIEALDRIENFNSENMEIHQGITGFSDEVFQYKDYSERMTKDMEKKLSKILEEGQNSTDTTLATKHALDKMLEDPGKNVNFLFTFTDGEPNDSDSLKEVIKDSKETRREKNIKLGIIWLTESDEDIKEAEEQAQQLKEEFGYDFGMAITTNEFEKDNKKENFAQRLANLLEMIIRDPDKF